MKRNIYRKRLTNLEYIRLVKWLEANPRVLEMNMRDVAVLASKELDMDISEKTVGNATLADRLELRKKKAEEKEKLKIERLRHRERRNTAQKAQPLNPVPVRKSYVRVLAQAIKNLYQELGVSSPEDITKLAYKD